MISILSASYLFAFLLRRPSTKSFSITEHLVMGRKLTLPLFVGTLMATWYGGIFGVTAIAFDKGLYNFLTQGLFWYVTYLIFAFFMVKRIRKSQAITLPDLVGSYLGSTSRKITAVLNFLNLVPTAYVLSLGILINLFFPIGLFLSSAVGLIFIFSYSLFGGFRSIVLTDFIQSLSMITAVVSLVVFSYFKFGGIDFLSANLPEDHLSLTGNQPLGDIFIWGFIALSTLVDPNFYQRALAAKNDQTAKWGIVITCGFWVIFDLCTTFGALYAKSVMPALAPQDSYLTYALNILPQGFKGIFIAGMISTIVSTIDSYTFGASTALSYDFFPQNFKRRSFQLAMIFTGVLALLLGHFFSGDVAGVWKTFGGLSASCLLVPVLFLLFFPQKISPRSFNLSVLVSSAVFILWKALEESFPLFDSFYAGAFCSSIILTGSLLDKRETRTFP